MLTKLRGGVVGETSKIRRRNVRSQSQMRYR